ncbi:MAG TPA: TonB family protein [Vicinamibacterales bacterium]|nr:TonB family protein [Vicinamibacterales bacterium]
MFDLITGNARHLPRHAALPIIASTAAQVLVVGSAIAIPILFVTDTMPEIPTMMAFVAAPPPPPPPPPPPAPAQPKPVATRPAPTSVSQAAAPIEPPATLTPERANDEGLDVGVPGGVEGGIPGGIVGGVIGGLPEAPPPPPPPVVAKGPVRIGGQIQSPALVKRVEPQYPEVAVSAHLEGVVILEAIVGREGTVEDVKVLRSVHPLLDREAEFAVRQWRYSPLVLNGTRERFVLTVTLSFHLESVS